MVYFRFVQWQIQSFPQVGANFQKPIILHLFCRELHENERIGPEGPPHRFSKKLDLRLCTENYHGIW